jgi:hypothetical protein
MSELEDFEKEPTVESESSELPRWPYWVGAVVVVAVIIAVVLLRNRPEEVVETPAPTPPAMAEEAPGSERSEPLEIGALPELDTSDAWLRGLIGQLSAHPELAEWLVTDEMIRRFVAMVDNLAEGTSPRSHLPFMVPEEPFKIEERDGQYFVDPASYERYDSAVEVVTSIDSDGAAQLYTALLPLFREAYQDLGYPGQTFDDAMRQAVDRLLEAPVVSRDIEVTRKVSSYELADPELEKLPSASKNFLRFGPRNLRQLQSKAREIAARTDLDVN